MGRLVAVPITAICALLAGCATKQEPAAQAMTQAPPQPVQQAPARTPQPVQTPLPPPTKEPAAPPPGSGPYVSVQAGWSFARQAEFRDDTAVSPTCFLAVNYPGVCGGQLDGLGSSFILGAGVGYRFANGFRADVTYTRRGGYSLSGSDPEGTVFDPDVTSDAVMINGYYDLPIVWQRFRPYVGGGIGRSRNSLDPINWRDPTSSGQIPGGRTTDTAWQITLGAVIGVGDRMWLDLSYRYADLGEIVKSAGPDLQGQFNPPPNGTGPATGKLRANEIFVNFRYDIGR